MRIKDRHKHMNYLAKIQQASRYIKSIYKLRKLEKKFINSITLEECKCLANIKLLLAEDEDTIVLFPEKFIPLWESAGFSFRFEGASGEKGYNKYLIQVK